MDEKAKTAFIAGAVALGIGVPMIALILLLKGEPPVGGLPINVACKTDGDCPQQLKCADCMECHLAQGRCVYKLTDSEYCQCVQGEIMPCDAKGIPGVKACEPTDQGTKWGSCNKI